MTFGSLFTGIGGFDLGFERAGMRCLWQVERHPFRRRVLEKQWPGVQRWDDIQTFPPSWLCGSNPDVICGGPPCQRTSVAAAIHGNRTGESLWSEMFRVVCAFGPRFVVVEQPSGNKEWEQKVEGDLERAGYDVSRLKRQARDSGAPHRRRRVFIIANTMRERWEAGLRQAGSSATKANSWPPPPRGAWRQTGAGNRRVDDGVSDWVDRIEALGDSLVPHEAEWIGRRIVEAIA